jgi:hypothetical protein
MSGNTEATHYARRFRRFWQSLLCGPDYLLSKKTVVIGPKQSGAVLSAQFRAVAAAPGVDSPA